MSGAKRGFQAEFASPFDHAAGGYYVYEESGAAYTQIHFEGATTAVHAQPATVLTLTVPPDAAAV